MLFGKKISSFQEQPEAISVKIEKLHDAREKDARTSRLPDPLDRTVIGEGITFIGNFDSRESIEINGSIRGDIHSERMVKISSTGSYYGNADMQELISGGIINGKIDCRESTTFSSTAKMVGTLNTPVFTSAAGAAFKGDLDLSGKTAAGQKLAESPRKPSEKEMPMFKEDGDVPVTEKDIFG